MGYYVTNFTDAKHREDNKKNRKHLLPLRGTALPPVLEVFLFLRLLFHIIFCPVALKNRNQI